MQKGLCRWHRSQLADQTYFVPTYEITICFLPYILSRFDEPMQPHFFIQQLQRSYSQFFFCNVLRIHSFVEHYVLDVSLHLVVLDIVQSFSGSISLDSLLEFLNQMTLFSQFVH